MLLTSRDRLQAQFAEATATTESDFIVWFTDASIIGNRKLTKSNGVTAVDVALSPPTDLLRDIKGILFKNRDTITHTVQFFYFDGSAQWGASPSFTVPPAYALEYTPTDGWILLTPTGVATQALSGGVLGTSTNDNAPAGFVGEYIESDAGAVVLMTTATPTNIATIVLSAGDWQVWGSIVFSPDPTTLVTQVVSSISLVSATLPTPGFLGKGAEGILGVNFPAGALNTVPAAQRRVSIAVASTVYLVGQCAFTVAAQRCIGFLAARRAR